MIRQPGGPKPSVNLLRLGAEEVAEVVKRRLLNSSAALDVFVDELGDVRTERTHDNRRARDLPDRWRVGNYTRRARQIDIEDDLSIRLKEITA